jgi:hypothetical protein
LPFSESLINCLNKGIIGYSFFMVCFYNGRKKFWDGKGNVSKIKNHKV